MILLSKRFLVLLPSLLCSTNIYASPLHLRRTNIWHAAADSDDREQLICRVTIKETTFDDGNGGIQDDDDVVCIKQIDKQDSSTILSLADLPPSVYKANEKEIALGKLYMLLTGISVDCGGNVIISNETEFTILENFKNRNLQEEEEEDARPIGVKTLAIVRISTNDAQVTSTAEELQQLVLDESPHASNMMSQFREMSFGQLTFQPKGVYEIFIDQSISSFTGLTISEATEIAMVEQLGLENASDLADRVLFCVPPGYQNGFIAFTYRNYWRATFSDKFCHSMSATVHEFGHTFGLGHSHWQEPDDYQDVSCYMGLGGGDAHAPRQTFNAHKSWQTGWYASRHLTFDPFVDGKARQIEVAALVDFEKTSDGQAVIVNIADHVYFQYNRAKGFNIETRAMPDTLVVVESHGNGNSGRIAALKPSDGVFEIPNFKESEKKLIIEVCSEEFSDAEDEPDLLVVSIGFSQSACSAPVKKKPVLLPPPQPSASPSAAPIIAPTKSPTLMPSKLPHHAPSHLPSAATTEIPTSMPSTTPSHAPSQETIAAPSTTPSNAPASPSPSHAPSLSPSETKKPSSTPSSSPTASPSISSSPSTSPSVGPSNMPNVSLSSPPTTSPSSFPSSRPSTLPSSGPSTSPSSVPSITPSSTPSSSPKPSSTPSSSPTASPSISSSPSTSPSIGPSNMPNVSPSSPPTTSPSSFPSSRPSTSPSSGPSTSPSSAPSITPSSTPSSSPSATPSVSPSTTPSSSPSSSPSESPSSTPSTSPSSTPSSLPSTSPSTKPSSPPSSSPSESPSSSPSTSPSSTPSSTPSTSPSTKPSSSPSTSPSVKPSSTPSAPPSSSPSANPSLSPSAIPSSQPSFNPSNAPSPGPSVSPSSIPSVTPSRPPSSRQKQIVDNGSGKVSIY